MFLRREKSEDTGPDEIEGEVRRLMRREPSALRRCERRENE
jgi:hypothetical protein